MKVMFYSDAAFCEGCLGVDAEIVQKGSGKVKDFNITKMGLGWGGVGIRLPSCGFLSTRLFLKLFSFGSKKVAWYCAGARA